MPKRTTNAESTAAEFRRFARECRDLARDAKDELDRNQLLFLAESWEQLADEYEKLAQEQK
jgi:hypothetical protein